MDDACSEASFSSLQSHHSVSSFAPSEYSIVYHPQAWSGESASQFQVWAADPMAAQGAAAQMMYQQPQLIPQMIPLTKLQQSGAVLPHLSLQGSNDGMPHHPYSPNDGRHHPYSPTDAYCMHRHHSSSSDAMQHPTVSTDSQLTQSYSHQPYSPSEDSGSPNLSPGSNEGSNFQLGGGFALPPSPLVPTAPLLSQQHQIMGPELLMQQQQMMQQQMMMLQHQQHQHQQHQQLQQLQQHQQLQQQQHHRSNRGGKSQQSYQPRAPFQQSYQAYYPQYQVQHPHQMHPQPAVPPPQPPPLPTPPSRRSHDRSATSRDLSHGNETVSFGSASGRSSPASSSRLSEGDSHAPHSPTTDASEVGRPPALSIDSPQQRRPHPPVPWTAERLGIQALPSTCVMLAPTLSVTEATSQLRDAVGRLVPGSQQEGADHTASKSTHALKMLCRCHRVDEARHLLHLQQCAGLPLNKQCFLSIIRSLKESRRWADAFSTFGQLIAAGLTPPPQACNMVIDTCGKASQLAHIFAVLHAMVSAGVSPDVVTATTLISACGRDGMLKEAREAWEWMTEAGIKPNTYMYNALINAYAKALDPEGAILLLREMDASGDAECDTLNTLHVAQCPPTAGRFPRYARCPRSPLAIGHWPLIAHNTLLTTPAHDSLLTAHYSPLTTHHSVLTTHCTPLTTHYPLLNTPC